MLFLVGMFRFLNRFDELIVSEILLTRGGAGGAGGGGCGGGAARDVLL